MWPSSRSGKGLWAKPRKIVGVLSEAVVSRLQERLVREHEDAGRINKRESSIIDAALVVLADGRPRTYSEIFAEAVSASSSALRQTRRRGTTRCKVTFSGASPKAARH